MKARRWMWIVWPAFLMAGILEMVVFAFVDPLALDWFEQPVVYSREAMYTFSFFVFWLFFLISGSLTMLLSMSSEEVNHRALPGEQRSIDGARLSS